MKTVFLMPGELYFSKAPVNICTMLGSCVGVAIFDTKHRWGGLNHYLLVGDVEKGEQSPRYGVHAIPALVELFNRAGSNKKDLIAKVFGGASVLTDVSIGTTVGIRNIEYARNILLQLRIPVREENVGGDIGRRIILDTLTGVVAHNLIGAARSGLVA
jgi:chemotaxis protein CheD